MINADEVLSHLGKSTEDPSLQEFLKKLGLPPNGPRLKGGFGDQAVPAEGFVLLYKTASHHPDIQKNNALPANAKVFSDVQFRAAGVEGGPPYSGELPYGLKFTDSRAATRARLGAPNWSSPIVNNDRWEYGDRFVTVDFSPDESFIKRVNVGLFWKT